MSTNVTVHLSPDQIDRLQPMIVGPENTFVSFPLDPDEPFSSKLMCRGGDDIREFAAALRRLADRIDLAVGDFEEDAYRAAEHAAMQNAGSQYDPAA